MFLGVFPSLTDFSSYQSASVVAACSSSLHPAYILSKYRFCGFRKRQAAGNKFRLQNMSIETYEWHQRHMGHVVLRSVQWGFTCPIFTHRRPAIQHSCSLKRKPKTILAMSGTLWSTVASATVQVDALSWFSTLTTLYRCLVEKIRALSMPAGRWWLLSLHLTLLHFSSPSLILSLLLISAKCSFGGLSVNPKGVCSELHFKSPSLFQIF